MEIYINETSLQGQYKTQGDFVLALRTFMSIFDIISKEKLQAFRNSLVLLDYEALKSSTFSSDLSHIRDKSLQRAFKDIVFNKTNPRDWKKKGDQLHDADTDIYYCEEINSFVHDTSLAEVAERNLINNQITRVLINFKDACFCKSHIEILKNDDAGVIQIEYVEDSATLIGKIPAKPWDALLDDTTRFRRTGRVHSKTGTPMFEELATGYIWYADSFHKTRRHFEVFNAQKEHIGEGDVNGKIDFTKADDKKKGKITL